MKIDLLLLFPVVISYWYQNNQRRGLFPPAIRCYKECNNTSNNETYEAHPGIDHIYTQHGGIPYKHSMEECHPNNGTRIIDRAKVSTA